MAQESKKDSHVMEIAILFFLILINGIFALSEIAFVSARRDEIEQFSLQGNRNATIDIVISTYD
jgi:putative hemolysin